MNQECEFGFQHHQGDVGWWGNTLPGSVGGHHCLNSIQLRFQSLIFTDSKFGDKSSLTAVRGGGGREGPIPHQ